MFDWADLLIAFVAGGFVAVWTMAMLVRRWLKRLRNQLIAALAEEAETLTNSMTKDKAMASDQIIPLSVEVDNNQYYCYNSKTNQFVCQGKDLKEIIDQFKSRFPGLNAFFESGDATALATLKQQFKEQNESSNSIRPTS